MEKEENHFRYYFRILRPDEDINHLRAKDSEKEPPCNEIEVKQSIQEHIKSGSSGYKSPWISTTAELHVALAFSGVISRVAEISSIELHEEKKISEIICLDKDYLRTILTEGDAVLRSKRSDEVLVFKEINCAKLLDKKINKVERVLHPNYIDTDSELFPELSANSSIKSVEMIGRPNKGLFRIEIDGKLWLARLGRPNYDLEKPVLFNKELTRFCKHQFTTMCAYRCLDAAVPKCALYIFDMSANTSHKYESALMLMENMEFCHNPKDARRTAQRMFPMDLLLGNWDPIEGVSDAIKLVSPKTGAFFMKDDGVVVRLSLDRALGCIYPEDKTKSDKIIVEFDADNLGLLKKTLEDTYKWCYRRITEKDFVQMTMDMVNKDRFKKMKDIIKMSPGLPWNKHTNITGIIDSRIKCLLKYLPFHKIIPATPPQRLPPARDGHGAIAIDNEKNDMKMLICGGNSKRGPLNDLWEFNFLSKTWTDLPKMPCSGRYSFSMHLFLARYVIVFGGCVQNGKRMEVKGDLLWYDIRQQTWHTHIKEEQVYPDARCRHGSYLKDIDESNAEMIIIGGHDKRGKKRKDVWRLRITQSDSLTFTWVQERDSRQKHHRGFLFAHHNSYYLLGGFGRNLRNLEEITDGKSIVVTNLPASEEESFIESKSLAGFSAVYDPIEERVILIGGGNVGTRNGPSHTKSNKALGNIPEDKEVISKPRVMILNHVKDSEWDWKDKEPYSSLDEAYQLPNLLSWTLVLMDHSVILFGGRINDDWSNEIYKIDLHPELKSDIVEMKEDVKILKDKISKRCKKYNGKKLEMLQKHVRDATEGLVLDEYGQ